ncbi:surface-associated interspersed protein 1.3 putative [Plasmodium sp. gorilla clade G2]|uniref:surface-associated interspersed protein 1.3 putative n=1 Tax=Plasmodium sp. gorilla clade G2 TaxID=880535 RepID=UPI000D223938|nr:surface-associated interspersed protein 1.3 putative [Plasmodium sp. gorilla clade G2]SOV13347.1 surface-associated interspersed protein 1.3 putative [Plasmodium sp. gorilla clade G2]
MAVKIHSPVSRKKISSTTYPLYFTLFFERLKNYVSDRISNVKNSENYNKLCRHLNYDIDDAQEIFSTYDFLNIPRDAKVASWNRNIENHLEREMRIKSENKCKRIYPFYPRIQRHRRKMLEDYCEERDKRRDEVNASDNYEQKCLEFNEWVITNENAINNSFNNNITDDDRIKGAYTIDNNCTLRKASILFPRIECKNEEEKKEDEPEEETDSDDEYSGEEDEGPKEPDDETDSDDEDPKEPETPNPPPENEGTEIPGFSNLPPYVGFNHLQTESGRFVRDSPRLIFDMFDNFFQLPIFGKSKITSTAEGFSHIFNIRIPPTNVVVPTPKIPPTGNPPMQVTPYLIFIPIGLLILLISIILNLMDKKKEMIAVRKEEKVKVKTVVPSAVYIRIKELEKLREEIKEKQKEKLKKKIQVKKKVEIIEDPYKIKLLERKKWLWKTIIEIHMLILEEQRKAEWEFNKGDFLNICIDEFSRQEKKSDINVITSDLLFGEEKDVETIYMMNKQSDMWYRWVERHEHMLEKWKEEEWFLRLKESWRDEEEEYMKRAYKELLISLRGDKYHMSQRQKIIWRIWIAKHPFRVREFVIDKWFNKLFEELEKEGIISDEAIRNFISLHEEQYDEEQIEEFIKYKKKVLVVILWIKIYMSILEEYIKEEDIESEKLFIDTSFEELKKKKEIEEEVIEDLKKDIYGIDKMKELEKYKGEDWFKQMQQDWIRREYKFVSSYNLGSDDEEEFYEFVKKPTMEIQKDLLKEQWRNIELKWIDEDNDEDWLEDELLKKRKYIKPEDKMKHRIIREDDIYSEELKIYDEIEKRGIYLLNKKVLKWKIIIEIHLEVLYDCKMEQWEKNKEDFLDICIEELVKKQNEDKKKS